jgi:hypothetical protein
MDVSTCINGTPHARLCRTLLREGNGRPVYIVPGRSAPTLRGHGYYWTTPGGKPIRYPSAYKWAKVYQSSTLRIEVGTLWLARRDVEAELAKISRKAERLASKLARELARTRRNTERLNRKIAKAERFARLACRMVRYSVRVDDILATGACYQGVRDWLHSRGLDGKATLPLCVLAKDPNAAIYARKYAAGAYLASH